MGNICINSRDSSRETANLIDSEGNFRRKIQLPVKAAELMLEDPGYVISPVDKIRSVRRITALKADDEILAGKVYLLVPVSRVNCKVTVAEMEIVEVASARKMKSKKSLRRAKVLPVAPVELSEGKEEEEAEEVKAFGGNYTGSPGYLSKNFKQWIPVLEPISE